MKLTDEQIAELAPDWATHYKRRGKVLVFESSAKYQFYRGGSFGDVHVFSYGRNLKLGKPVQSNNFNLAVEDLK